MNAVRSALAGMIVAAAATWAGCVGDEPSPDTPSGSDASPDSTASSDGAPGSEAGLDAAVDVEAASPKAMVLHLAPSGFVKIAYFPTLLPGNDFTIEFWARITGSTGKIFEKFVSAQEDKALVHASGETCQWIMVGSGGSPKTLSCPTPMMWHHYALSSDGTTARYYVDGSPKVTMSGAGVADASGSLFFGYSSERFAAQGDAANAAGVEMDLAEIRISPWSRYSGNGFMPAKRYAADGTTIGLWHLDEGTGQGAADSSGNERHGTIGGIMTWIVDDR